MSATNIMQAKNDVPARNTADLTLPRFHLLCILPECSEAFTTAVKELYPDLEEKTQIQIHNCNLQELSPSLNFDAVVSPANSYARLDGAFDDALAKTYTGPDNQYSRITEMAQKVLYQKWRGYAPPGTCTVVPLDRDTGENPRKTRFLLLCPTMRIPWVVNWDREVVYECIWSLLCAVDEQNRSAAAEGDKIESILMTPLGTGIGRISPRRWAEQCVLAMNYWIEAVENPVDWSSPEWEKIFDDHEVIVDTYRREM